MSLTLFKKLFPYVPTPCQDEAIHLMLDFLNTESGTHVFLLTGYAGTGKTTFISVLVSYLRSQRKNSVLLAPTGRAAKVAASYAGSKAFTIHKRIYSVQASETGLWQLKRQPNFYKNTVFIVDEASMIHNADNKSGGHLLDDLVAYVGDGENCKLILTGDEAQLPPVGAVHSPALVPEYMRTRFGFFVIHASFKTVVRQEQESGILHNATALRNIIGKQELSFPFFGKGPFPDMCRVEGSDLRDVLDHSYANYGLSDVIILCRSNKRANLYNKHIRNGILFRENEIAAGDMMMVVKNNYFWLPKEHSAGFIANGDIIEIMRINKSYNLYGFDFADVSVRLTDYPDEAVFDTTLLLNTIETEGPALSYADSKKLYDEVLCDYDDIQSEREKMAALRMNPQLNALQVKFSYAITVHKAQGGQWHSVFIDHGFLNDSHLDISFVRWLYTAVTRATDKVWLINFNTNLGL